MIHGFSPSPRRPFPALRPASLASTLLGLAASAYGQSSLPPDDPFAAIAPSTPATNNLSSPFPSLPWLPAEATLPASPRDLDAPASPFLRPGLGTTSFGDAALPVVPLTPRGFGESAPILLGPLDLFPSLGYDVLYGTGIQAGPNRDEASWRQTITPAVAIRAGDHWTVTYTPQIRLYSADAFDNVVNHTVALAGWASYEDWRFRLNHATAITDDPLVETARQTDQTTHTTALGATWDRGVRGALDLSVIENIRLTSLATDVYSWTGQAFYDYPFFPRLSLGAGLSLGYDLVDVGTDMVNERFNVRATGSLGRKLTYRVGSGFELRQFVNTGTGTSVSPLANANLSYQILEKTALTAGVSHDVNTSFFSDQFTENTSIQGGVDQDLTDQWSVGANAGVRFSTYSSTLAGTNREREDSTTFANVRVTGRLLPSLTLTLYYAYRANDSDLNGFSFGSSQVGLRLRWSL